MRAFYCAWVVKLPCLDESLTDDRRKELSINVISKLCGGIDLRLVNFFNSSLFDELDLELDPPAYNVPFFD